MAAAGTEAARARSAALQSLFDEVAAEPWAHDFFALIRRIDALRPEAPRTGQARRPGQEALRLGQAPELDFAPAAVAGFEARAGGARGR
jgi:type VI secretion system protein ImpH